MHSALEPQNGGHLENPGELRCLVEIDMLQSACGEYQPHSPHMTRRMSSWARLGRCSQDTASRDIDDLIKRGILVRNPGGGRSTSYSLAEGEVGG
jgi:predicted HTH transcriptional regulator